MTSRISLFILAGLLTFAPAINAQQASGSSAFAYTSPATTISVPSKPSRPRGLEAPRDILEMMADSLDLSRQQKDQLETLLERQRDLLVALHQHAEVSDQQKSAQFQQIRCQTKEQFAAMLTSQQRREFESMTR